MTLDLNQIRAQFPSLNRPDIFLDNPGGTQIAKPALDRMVSYLTDCNANHEGAFITSQLSDAILNEAHLAVSDFLNAAHPEEIVFGANMTTLTLHISRSLSRDWNSGDEIVVTRLDHDANATPWVLAGNDRGCRVNWVDFHPEDGTLDLDQMEAALTRNPRLVAVGYASNALGTINPVKEIIEMAHAHGALVYIDAVHYAPHAPIDVQDLGCDFLVCSAYKFFGPHAGILFGKYELLEALTAYKVRPAPNTPPGKFETGTQNHEAIAGVLGAIEYLEWIGENFSGNLPQNHMGNYSGRRLRLKQAMTVIQEYETELGQVLLDVLQETPGIRIYGITDSQKFEHRVPTYAFNLQGWHPRKLAEALGRSGIYVWDGNYYALSVTERLGVEESGGMVRVGPVHYNNVDEIQRFGEILRKISSSQDS